MADIALQASSLSNSLQTLLAAEDIKPGDDISYQLCKTIYAYHPMGGKLVDHPVLMAQSQPRRISVPAGPEERLTEAFERQWAADNADKVLAQLMKLARVYGVASLAIVIEGEDPTQPLDMGELWDKKLGFNVLDPLNTAGSLVLNQDPNDPEFLKVGGITVAGKGYHRSRAVTLMHEDPLYIQYTQSGFGYVGRSIFQRALFPLKSFINTMVTNDLVSLKAGVIIAKISQQSSAIDRVMAQVTGQKRQLLKEAKTGNVLSIAPDEAIESLNLQNLDGAFNAARKNIIEDIATGGATPAKILLAETFAEGFGEGTEDAKYIAQHIQSIREWAQAAYDWMTRIVQHRAWNPEFYKTIQADFPEDYRGKEYKQAFYDWTNSFKAHWPSLIEEPESEKIKVDDVRLRAIIAMLEVLLPNASPAAKGELIQWAMDNFNALKLLFPTPLTLDTEEMVAWMEEQAEKMDELAAAGGGEGETEGVDKTPRPPKPFADAVGQLSAAVARLPDRQRATRARG